jgi:Transposase DDE domain group 1
MTPAAMLAGWPETMRVFARRERPHPRAQLTLFEAGEGYRYSLRVTNLPARLQAWRANPAYIDAAHRVHARGENGIRTGKDCGIGRFPSHGFAFNSAWMIAALLAAALLAWLKLIALDGTLAKAEPKTLRHKILHAAARLVRRARRRQLKIAVTWPGQPTSSLRSPGSPPSPTRPDPSVRVPSPDELSPHEAGGNLRLAGPLSYPDPKIKINRALALVWPVTHQAA